ncbi:hypothetical protein Cni_G05613 [Canna indica]|uniref:RNase H type-1 domain-containing protein n=1 Tax=Canna indica TaxID=4628 RepID=A0AAQ3JZQ7_9LILI|nr:hypothetical protein Cni_G05613 [Canna indica]
MTAWNHLRVLIDNHRPDLVLPVEIHLNDQCSLDCIKKFGTNWKGVYVAGDGRAGGLVLEPWLLSGVYASNNPAKRQILWEFLSKMDTGDYSWLIIGDFNCINKQEDKKGGNSFKWGKSVSAYRDMCISAGLLDVNYKGSNFTWCNNRKENARVWARLDRALINWKWVSLFSENSITHLSKVASDHKPILFTASNIKMDKKQKKNFIFEHYWPENKEIGNIIHSSWYSNTSQMNNMDKRFPNLFSLASNQNCSIHDAKIFSEFGMFYGWNISFTSLVEAAELSSLVLELDRIRFSSDSKYSRFKKKNLGSLESELKNTKKELEELDRLDELGLCSEQDLSKMKCFVNKTMALNRQLHIKWWSKARAKWMEQNDKNTRFFQSLAKFKKRRSNIASLNIDDKVVNDSSDIAKGFAKWYKSLWECDYVEFNRLEWGPAKELKWKKIANRRKEELCRKFTKQEIWYSIKGLGNITNCRNVMKTLNTYCQLTGQKININKSDVYFPKDCNVNIRDEICNEFGVSEGYWEKIEMEFKIRFKHKENWFEGKWTEEDLPDKSDFSKWLIELIAASLWNLWKNKNNCCFNNRKVGYNTLFYRSIADIQWSVEPFTNSFDTNCNSLKPDVMLGKQKVWAIWFGLTKAKELKLDRVEIHTDCLQAVNILNRKDKYPWFMYSIIRDIWLLMRSLNSCIVYHIGRNSNLIAHDLANDGYREGIRSEVLKRISDGETRGGTPDFVSSSVIHLMLAVKSGHRLPHKVRLPLFGVFFGRQSCRSRTPETPPNLSSPRLRRNRSNAHLKKPDG